ncbi:MAG: HD domain-containing protein [Lachnospiraceae bacterium]|nr:HD domain-containing protein [Lachnospiraceae bacterium]
MTVSNDNRTYKSLSPELQERIIKDRAEHKVNPYACKDEDIIRRDPSHDKANIWRPAFVRDVEKIMHIPYYSRYMDKTQVFSLYHNDDITRRAQHVQLVARIARNIGSVLNLNTDLIEAAALGHDIGHTPFGHPGEYKLSEIYCANTGRLFNHNIQSARVLDVIFPLNLSLQTLDGIICHNGEMECKNYKPKHYEDFATFDAKMEECYLDAGAIKRLVPSTLEACVVRVSDIIAYLGKDRQDAKRLGVYEDSDAFSGNVIGKTNAEIINNMTVNIIENSYGKDHLEMDDAFYEAFSLAKKENYQRIYKKKDVEQVYDEAIYPMIEKMYEYLLKEAKDLSKDSMLYKHHISYVEDMTKHYRRGMAYRETAPDELVVDYIASMTDDYFVELFRYLFPDSTLKVEYKGYFEEE